VAFRRLGRACELLKTTPQGLLEMAKRDLRLLTPCIPPPSFPPVADACED